MSRIESTIRSVFAEPKCLGKHQHFEACGSSCPPTCEFPKGKPVCTTECRIGCVCDRGYVRKNADGTGPCVKPSKCSKPIPPTSKPSCRGPHEHFESCGSSCPKTCKFPNGKRICTRDCKVGCVCDKGFVRQNPNGTGPCILPHECPKPIPPTAKPSCKGPHEHFVSCRGHCQSTCKHRNLDVVPCTRICKPGCVCDLGYVRANLNGTGPCIPTAKCSEPIPPTEKPSCKGPHEHFEPCGTSCPKTCEIPKGKRICTRDCRVGCFCDDGYVRQNANGTGLCILPSECPKPIPPTAKPSCKGPHEHFESCGSSCPKTCKSPNGKKICTLDCKVGCVCDPGFVRLNSDGTGPCILVGDCPAISPPTEKPSCKGEHEHYEKCTGHCQTTCKNPKLGLVPCTKICKSGCVCDMGYLVKENMNISINAEDIVRPLVGIQTKTKWRAQKFADLDAFVIVACKGKHEHFESCGSSCPKTCESPDGKKICTLECKVGCFCDLGFVRLNSDGSGPCIPKEKCSKPIPPTQKQCEFFSPSNSGLQ
ncbi:Inducible metalloproteinase-like protein [Sarcoptes scabiei]|uniref:Inducible metalloproteinase-like protein n=1 Tax=Sarcoptes scabiei TaxID=52283 RepID=A0A131ZZU6_SARSC|nr:Inducible metalloproteinase-like protein [Sarcoptes scabiei]